MWWIDLYVLTLLRAVYFLPASTHEYRVEWPSGWVWISITKDPFHFQTQIWNKPRFVPISHLQLFLWALVHCHLNEISIPSSKKTWTQNVNRKKRLIDRKLATDKQRVREHNRMVFWSDTGWVYMLNICVHYESLFPKSANDSTLQTDWIPKITLHSAVGFLLQPQAWISHNSHRLFSSYADHGDWACNWTA